MKTLVCTLLFFIVSGYVWNQTNTGLIIGEGVRTRTKPTTKSKEISKVYGMRLVTIVEEGEKWDALGETDPCEQHTWVKVTWEGDSTGWVYGKFCFKRDDARCLRNSENNILWMGKNYAICIFANYQYPIANADGITGCGDELRLMLYDQATNTYYPVKDTLSKENQSTLVLYDSDGIAERIQQISVKNNQLILDLDIGYQEGMRTAVYTIKKTGNGFEVVSYMQSDVQY
jgi:hypothetical protein